MSDELGIGFRLWRQPSHLSTGNLSEVQPGCPFLAFLWLGQGISRIAAIRGRFLRVLRASVVRTGYCHPATDH
jgi:hypothetical protein